MGNSRVTCFLTHGVAYIYWHWVQALNKNSSHKAVFRFRTTELRAGKWTDATETRERPDRGPFRSSSS